MKKNCSLIGVIVGSIFCWLLPSRSVVAAPTFFQKVANSLPDEPLLIWCLFIGGGSLLGWLVGAAITSLSKRHDDAA